MMLRKVTPLRNFGVLLATAAAVFATTTSRTAAAPQRCALQPEHAAMLVMQTPPAAKAKASGGCPAADYEQKEPGMAAFRVRNLCATSGYAELGAYLVDLNSGQVWEDGETHRQVESPALRTARTQVCAMSVKGVIPSLLPQGHTSRARTRRVAAGPATRTQSTARKTAARAKKRT